jgi:diguanylate cyclase (GGDEF)-like protein
MVDMTQPVYNRFKLDQVIVLNAQGQIRVNIAPSHLESISVVRRDLLPTCTQPQEYLVQYLSEHLLIVCAPIRASSTSDVPIPIVGYVYTVLDLPELLERIQRDLELVATPQIVAVEHTDASQHVSEGHLETGALPADGNGNFRARIVPVVVGGERMNLSLMVDAHTINAIVASGLRVMLISNAIAIALSVLAVALAIRHMLTNPLLRLTAVAEQVAAGDLSARAQMKSYDEIGQLARTFNNTTAQLQELVLDLEHRVDQRTTELTAMNAYLEQEIIERKRAEEHIRYQKQELERLAITDELTGLYNRRHFFTLAEHEILVARTSAHFLSAMMIDIDYFKKINDTYGHATGDHVLRKMAQRCRENLRDTDIVGRYGGEEFAILLPRTDPETAMVIAERLRAETARAAIQTERGLINITISIGIAAAVQEYLDLTRLLERADDALYTAKRLGRNRVVLAEQTLPLV